MKSLLTYSTFLFFLSFLAAALNAQVSTNPALPTAEEPVTVIFNATGTPLANHSGPIYAHTGLYTENGGDAWHYVIGEWGDNNVQPQLTHLGGNNYELQITPSINEYYNVHPDSVITGMNFVFRAAGGSPQTDDYNLPVVQEGLMVSITAPDDPQAIYEFGDVVQIQAVANSASSIRLYINDVQVHIDLGNSLSYNWTANAYGRQDIRAVAFASGVTAEDETAVFVRDEVTAAPLPAGLENGINYIDNNTVTLVLHDPPGLKEYAFVIGDFNEWMPSSEHFMNVTPDGTRFWLTITDLEADTEYGFQYYIDGELRIADPYTHKVLDPWNDQWVDEYNYPNLKPYPHDHTDGLVSIMHPGHTPFPWNVTDFTPPDKDQLVIYELLIRDFVETSAIKDVQEKLDYLEDLGINAVQLMPINQFEGNISWGYNPALYFATDKAYGTREDYKAFIDAAHERGIAVILDIVLNHSFNLSPLAQMYFDPDAGSWGQPSAENPWYLQHCPHEPWCWGNTFDQESPYTQQLFKDILQYWLLEFKVDGFRFDFAKGFTNHQTGGQGWNYDAARIANLKRIADEVWEVNPNAYVILEHFTENAEEQELSDYGMMLWGNISYNYQEAAMGWLDNSNFEWASYQQRGWNDPHLIGYMESHDEERIMFKNLQYGNSSGSYDIKELVTALERAALVATFNIPLPGPRMIWQFGELGYDYSINHCQDGTIDPGCRTDPKPVRWDYYDQPHRKALYDVYSALAHLKREHAVFRTNNYHHDLGGAMKRIHLNHFTNNVTILGNFGVVSGNINPHFQETGTWYEFFTGETLEVTNVNQLIHLQPGEYRLYSSVHFDDVETIWVNLQWPPVGEIDPEQEFITYAQVWIDGLTGEGVTESDLQDLNAWIGYSTTDASDESDFDEGWIWVEASLDSYEEWFGNNSQYSADIGSTISSGGDYFYVSRVQFEGGDYIYGGYSETGGGFWDGTNSVSGHLSVADITFQVSFSAKGEGSITASVDGAAIASDDMVVEGSDVLFIATPDAGYQVKEWAVNGAVVSAHTGESYTYTDLEQEITVTVEFEEIPPTLYAVNFNVVGAGGSLSAEVDGMAIASGDMVVEGSDVLFIATPDAGYQVKEWTVNRVVVSAHTDESYTYTDLDQEITVTVAFEEVEEPVADLHIAIEEDVLVVDEDCFFTMGTITVAGGDYVFTVKDGAAVNMAAGKKIHFLPGSSVESGGYLIAYISEEDICGRPFAREKPVEKDDAIKSIDVADGSLFFRMYPNPAESEITIEMGRYAEALPVRVDIVNIMGNTVFSEEIPAQQQYRLDLADLHPGMYVVRVIQGEKIAVERLIIR